MSNAPLDKMEKITQPTVAPQVKPVWMITGCSTGFGRHLAEYLLSLGYRVVVTARNLDDVSDFKAKSEALVLKLDVTKPNDIEKAVKAAEHHFGHVDVLVNNAGIGYFAAIEEGNLPDVRKMFDINVFGLTAMTCAVLPSMRKRRRGVIINLSSIGGLCAYPALGYYNASKFAVEGLSEALRQELAPLGIHVMVVEPSGFRTDWAGRSAEESTIQIHDYLATAGEGRRQIRSISGKQEGDPVKAVHAIVKAIESPHPPNHLLLGNAAYDSAISKLDELRDEFHQWEALTRGADFAQPTKTAPTIMLC